MTSHADVIDRFVERGRPLKGSHIFADEKAIYSYGTHFPMAIAVDERKLFIVNGDTWGPTTSRHQGDVRSSLSRSNYERVIIPFSALRVAGIDIESIKIVEHGYEINEAGCRTCNISLGDTYDHHLQFGKYSGLASNLRHDIWTRHLLAPSLITATRTYFTPDPEAKDCSRCGYDHNDENFSFNGWKHEFNPMPRKVVEEAYFLSGFDETARAWGGGYFLSQLPHKVKTIAEAFTSLAPKPVLAAINDGKYVKRQGDIFGIPDEKMTTRRLNKIGKKLPIQKTVTKTLLDWNNEPWRTVTEPEYYNIGDQALPVFEQGSYKFHLNGYRPQLLGTNHYATEAYQVERRGVTEVWARGNLYHLPAGRPADHKVIKLGKLWHRIYRNTAVGSWSASGTMGRVD